MADLATPSAAEMNSTTARAHPAHDKPAPPAKPERPDEEAYKNNLTKAEKELRAAEDRMKQIKSKFDMARPNNKDTPSAKRQQELRTELQTIRTQQQSSKSSRGQVMDKIKRLDENLKSRITEQKTARSKVQFKSVEEVQDEIDRLQKQVDTGIMRLVDEKKALADISQLNRQKRGFAVFDEAQKGIDEVKKQIADLRTQLDDPESRAMSERYTEIAAELDAIKAEQDEAYKSLHALRDERTKAHEEQQKRYHAVKEIRDAYFTARRAAQDYDREARRVREEKRKAENDAYHRGRRQEAAKEKLDDASAPAYQAEIRTAQTLLAHFDPSSAVKHEVAGPGRFAATPQRTIDGEGIKGTRLVRKGVEEENYFIGSGGKKKKGGRQQQPSGGSASPAAAPATPTEGGKFNLDLGTIDGLGKLGVDPPMSQSDVPAVAEKLKAKLDHWRTDQARKTKENVAKAQAEIDRLEAEAQAADRATTDSAAARKPAAADKAHEHVNGSASESAAVKPHREDATTNGITEQMQKADVHESLTAEQEGTTTQE